MDVDNALCICQNIFWLYYIRASFKVGCMFGMFAILIYMFTITYLMINVLMKTKSGYEIT